MARLTLTHRVEALEKRVKLLEGGNALDTPLVAPVTQPLSPTTVTTWGFQDMLKAAWRAKFNADLPADRLTRAVQAYYSLRHAQTPDYQKTDGADAQGFALWYAAGALP